MTLTRGPQEWVGVALACAAGAALSLLVLPAVPTTDSWGWIVWGRELLGLDLDTGVGGAPSWKPLPVLFTAPLSFAGDAAPLLWVWLARAGGLLGLVLAYRVGSRLARPAAGVAGALLLVVSGGWLRSMAHGYTEPLLAAIVLAGVGLHLSGRRRAALGALFAACLARPELWPVLLGYGWFAAREEPRLRPLAVGLGVSVPVLWVGVDWLASGELLHGGREAQGVSRSLSFPDMLELAARLVGLPALALAGVAAAAGGPARRLAGVTSAWVLFVSLLPVLGYPASERFFAPAVPIACLLAGAGVCRLLEVRPLVRPARLAAAGAASLVLLLFAGARLADFPRQAEAVRDRAALQEELRHAARQVRPVPPGAAAVVPYGLQWNTGALAWELELPLSRVMAPDPERSPAPSELAALPLASTRPLLSRDVREDRSLRVPLPFEAARRLVLFLPTAETAHLSGRGGLERRRLPTTGPWRVIEVR